MLLESLTITLIALALARTRSATPPSTRTRTTTPPRIRAVPFASGQIQANTRAVTFREMSAPAPSTELTAMESVSLEEGLTRLLELPINGAMVMLLTPVIEQQG